MHYAKSVSQITKLVKEHQRKMNRPQNNILYQEAVIILDKCNSYQYIKNMFLKRLTNNKKETYYEREYL